MTRTFIIDTETDGLLETVTRIHCLVAKDINSGEIYRVHGAANIKSFLVEFIQPTDKIIGHNFLKYDYAVIKKLYPTANIQPSQVIDTLVIARLIWSNIKDIDAGLLRKGTLPGKLFGAQSLKAWGYRLGILKGTYGEADDAWAIFTTEMLEYCVQDVEVTHALYSKIMSKDYSQKAIDLEHAIAWLMAKQEVNGFPFDTQAAGQLYGQLSQRRSELEKALMEFFGSWHVQLPDFIPKRDNKTLGYKAGVPVQKFKTIEFNPQSRDHIANRLTTLYGWEPKEFTESGKPEINETTLAGLSYPPCALLKEYLLVCKRISQLAEGSQGWLKVERNGKIHGSVNTCGAVTGRATHAYPNVAQVPRVRTPYGKECRALFGVPKGWTQVGSDASGLELRCLAHFMSKYDQGAYIDVLLNGDIHTTNQLAAGLPTRDMAKTFIYALMYGGGDAKIGSIVGGDESDGKKLKSTFFKKTPALKLLREAVVEASRKGHIKGLDGRHLHIRSQHSALNTLLQSAGALICKKWCCLIEELLISRGYKHGWGGDFAFMAWVHKVIVHFKPGEPGETLRGNTGPSQGECYAR